MTSIDQNKPNILLGSESFALDRGGVSRVGRLVSHVLTDAGKGLLAPFAQMIEDRKRAGRRGVLACAGGRLRFRDGALATEQPLGAFRVAHSRYHAGRVAISRVCAPTPFGFTE